MTKNRDSTWTELRRLADELEVQVHLAGMEARDRWRALQPRLVELQRDLSTGGTMISDAIERELAALGTALRDLRDELTPPLD
ncbi:MAG TPA: hypothetical protein VFQ65_06865 [Kofleriaceae bacterium]|nr:hypothetical protein [Kofleriaceae bacterium]